MESNLDAKFMRECAMIYSDQDEGRGRRLTGYTDSEGVQKGALYLHLKQVAIQGRTDSVLTNPIESVRTERGQLLGVEVCLRTCWFHPDVGAGASDETGLRRETIEVMLRLDLGRDVRSIGRWSGFIVAIQDCGFDVLFCGRHKLLVSLNVGYGEALKKGDTQGEEIGKGRILSNLVDTPTTEVR